MDNIFAHKHALMKLALKQATGFTRLTHKQNARGRCIKPVGEFDVTLPPVIRETASELEELVKSGG